MEAAGESLRGTLDCKKIRRTHRSFRWLAIRGNRRLRTAFQTSLVLIAFALAFDRPSTASETENSSYKLLLTPQRIKRLRRDRERQTVRWANFENRVLNVPDSPERGFELALYFAVGGDPKSADQAVVWAKAHPSEYRQLSLILDWCRGALTHQDASWFKATLQPRPSARRISDLRDEVFSALAAGRDVPSQVNQAWKNRLDQLKNSPLRPEDIYALCEYLDTVNRATHEDLRSEDADFFGNLPAEFLLAVKPQELIGATWKLRAAALALVSLDPNLVNSQFLQGWAMEDRQIMADGPGVAYGFLWGNPYLPGVSYQNLDPWLYDRKGRLFARSDWQPNSCWIAITPAGTQEQNCPATWRTAPTEFGRLTLIPATEQCLEIPADKSNRTAILWGLKPGQKLTFRDYARKDAGEADAGGLFHVPFGAAGKICARAQ